MSILCKYRIPSKATDSSPHSQRSVFVQATGMIAIVALSLTALSVGAGSGMRGTQAAAPPESAADFSAGAGYVFSGTLRSMQGTGYAARGGRWRLEGRLVAAEDEGRTAATTTSSSADADRDGQVDINDLLQVIEHWGMCPTAFSSPCQPDLDGDGQVNACDLAMVMRALSR
jgi:hypothetical protein